jgi:hypothetical protein
VWNRPSTSAAEFNADNAKCRLAARAMNKDDFEAHGRIGFVIAASLVHGIAQGAATQQDYNDCMQANGYVPSEPSTPPVAMASTAPPPAPRAPEALPTYPSAPTGNLAAVDIPASPPPVGPVSPAPSPGGRVVLSPVTINNSYHPSWTVPVQ